jgi:GTP-binding protein
VLFDEAKIRVRAGHGGDGCVAFRREWGVPRGGPSGGNGGKGGDVYVRATGRLNTLNAFEHQNLFAAERGQHGQGKDRTGRTGKDEIIDVPLGTVVRDAVSGQVMGDLIQEGQQICVARGGRGGRGNAAFATSTNQAPRISERGEPGEKRQIELELKLIAAVGLVGMPNAGKSTLLSAISAARPKIASYPFTTLQPNLGVVTLDYNTSFVVADLPGLIEGASRGAGLGHEFLRHVERTRLLVHVLDGMASDPLENYDTINGELKAFSEQLADKPQIVVVNKMDLPDVREIWPLIQEMLGERAIEVYPVSAVTGEGVRDVLWEVAGRLAELPAEVSAVVEAHEPRGEPQVDEKAFTYSLDEEGWHVHGVAIERIAAMTNWDQYESLARFQRVLEAMGITIALREAGVQVGDTVFVGDKELEWGWPED